MRNFENYIGEEFAFLQEQVTKLNNFMSGTTVKSWGKSSVRGMVVKLQKDNYLNRKEGTYFTFETTNYSFITKTQLQKELVRAIKNLIKEKPQKVLILGMGNDYIISDSLGTKTIEKIDVLDIMKNNNRVQVAKFCPSVLAVSGLESFDIAKAITSTYLPDVIIVVDSLCASRVERIGCSFQLTDAGIVPGSAVGSNVCNLSAETLGARVISIGVPMVVYLKSIFQQFLNKTKPSEDNLRRVFEENRDIFDGIFSPKDIDFLLEFATEAISCAIIEYLKSI